MSKTMSVSSTETIYVPVTAEKLGAPIDPTADPVSMAFLVNGADPQDSDAHAAFWQTWPGPVYVACCLVGPKNGGVALAKGRWFVWVRPTDSPDVPWLRADTLIIT